MPHQTVSDDEELVVSMSIDGGDEAGNDSDHDRHNTLTEKSDIQIQASPPLQRHLYKSIREELIVTDIVRRLPTRLYETWYRVAFMDGQEKELSRSSILAHKNGQNALNLFEDDEDDDDDDDDKDTSGNLIAPQTKSQQAPTPDMTSDRSLPSRKRLRTRVHITSDPSDPADSENDSTIRSSSLQPSKKLRSTRQLSKPTAQKSSITSQSSEGDSKDEDEDEEEEEDKVPVAITRKMRSRVTKASATVDSHTSQAMAAKGNVLDDDEDELAQAEAPESDSEDIIYEQPKQAKRTTRSKPVPTRSSKASSRSRGTSRSASRRNDSDSDRAEPGRRSGRVTTKVNMREHLEDEEQFADEEVVQKRSMSLSVREVFPDLPASDHFRKVHNQACDVCGEEGNHSNKGTSVLIYCQGCTTSIHKVCLGQRTTREHIVTKVGEGNFVLQCRRCVGVARTKDELAPNLGRCSGCVSPGVIPFSTKKTSKQEEKLRLENDGVDPITDVDLQLINNADKLLFRCTTCSRGFHFDHLPDDKNVFSENRGNQLFKKYSTDFNCMDCRNAPSKVQMLVAWRPVNWNTYNSNENSYYTMTEDEKEYLVKWLNKSYFSCVWMPGAWVWGSTKHGTRRAFIERAERDGTNMKPIATTALAIPEDYFRIEIVLDVRYKTGNVKVHTEAIDRARIGEVDEVYVKFEGLTYEDVVWDKPPPSDEQGSNEQERRQAFEFAYNEYVTGKYFKQPTRMLERVKDYRRQNFGQKHELKSQPASLTGGLMKEYQLEGLNYILYNFHQEKNCILADEMGLGKTIQIIATIAALVEKPKCWPFLVVVPNSTCPNWRREIKKWAPSLRVVTYYGGRAACDLAMKHELFPEGCSDMRAHIVVTSFDTPTEDHGRAFFKRIKWAGLFVDEGQRLKNEKTQLYVALTNLNVAFRVLLTGTPLQNNKRELFILLRFLDNSIDVEALDEKYRELSADNLTELHNLIRPFFLRRTKLQVLKELPAMAQIIVPLSMSTLQKQLYRHILEKSPELIKSLFSKDADKVRVKEKTSLRNILMQLRKVLCHPYLYSRAVEETHHEGYTGHDLMIKSHQTMVEASAKLQFLDLMLPKLRERGHRVLIFSQFLDMLTIIEDFLMGLGLDFRRLDGNIKTIEKQKRIDEFNAPGSDIFAFLLSTRAGGVGINLATADTVIIMDPDFNPHQDMQALSRAHRMGQQKKVLVFQLMTKQSAEEKIVQIGRKKMALDHVLIEAIDEEDEAGTDLTTVLAHGAQALFDKDDSQDIHYDTAAIDKLLDRSQVETTKYDDTKSGESQFSFARIWTNDKTGFVDEIADDDQTPDIGIWDKIIKEREAAAAIEAARQQTIFGRGKRQRTTVDYKNRSTGIDATGDANHEPAKDGDSDVEFADRGSDVDDDSDGVASPISVREASQGKANGQGRNIHKAIKPTSKTQPSYIVRLKIKKAKVEVQFKDSSRQSGSRTRRKARVVPVYPILIGVATPMNFPILDIFSNYPGPFSLWDMFAKWHQTQSTSPGWKALKDFNSLDFPLAQRCLIPLSWGFLFAEWLHHGRYRMLDYNPYESDPSGGL